MDVWRQYSAEGVEVSGKGVASGHYIPEEADDELLKEMMAFFA